MASLPALFLSCDWGTTAFRLRLVASAGQRVIANVTSDDGVNAINQRLGADAGGVARAAAFAGHLREAAARLLAAAPEAGTIPIVVSGMASASMGWRELQYASLPFALDGRSARVEWLNLDLPSGKPAPVLLVSGLAGANEMMRGEETQLIGLFAGPSRNAAGQDCIVVLPGTHSKHVKVCGHDVVDLQTFMTGELFQVLTRHSVLRFTTTSDLVTIGGEDFAAGVRDVRRRGLSRSLFQVRARGVLGGRSAAANRDYLSGLLVGDEMGALASNPELRRVIIAADQPLAGLYLRAAAIAGIGERCERLAPAPLDDLSIAGHARLLEQFGGG